MAEPHEIYLSPKVAEVLTTLVTEGRAQQVMTMGYIVTAGRAGGSIYMLTIGRQTYQVTDVQDDPMFALVALGFLVHDAAERQIFLTQAGVDWVNYHQQGRLAHVGHWLSRSTGTLVGQLVIGLTAALTIAQILQIFGGL